MLPLPKKFTDAERYAYKWLYDCDIGGWLVDRMTKEVNTVDRTYSSLVEFAEYCGMLKES